MMMIKKRHKCLMIILLRWLLIMMAWEDRMITEMRRFLMNCQIIEKLNSEKMKNEFLIIEYIGDKSSEYRRGLNSLSLIINFYNYSKINP
jgi:hypothetical protein